jgi:phage tail-like protein
MESVGTKSRYLQFLPAIYQADPVLERFLCIFEDMLLPIEDWLEQQGCYFDPMLTPGPFLPWLASWIDLALNENWPEERRRRLIRQGTELYRWRGTRKGLIGFLKLYAGDHSVIDIDEEMSADGGSTFRFSVTIHTENPGAVEPNLVDLIIRAEKPAHTVCTAPRIESLQRQSAPS